MRGKLDKAPGEADAEGWTVVDMRQEGWTVVDMRQDWKVIFPFAR